MKIKTFEASTFSSQDEAVNNFCKGKNIIDIRMVSSAKTMVTYVLYIEKKGDE